MNLLSSVPAAAAGIDYPVQPLSRPSIAPRQWRLRPLSLQVTTSPRLVALLAVLTLIVYVNALPAGFTFDDEPQIVHNPTVTNGIDLLSILATPLPPGDLYRPATVLSFALNQALAPGDAMIFHAVNVALHVLVTLLVFWLAFELFESARIAAIAATLFALHPIHTEAVTSLVGRAEEMGALFGLLAIVLAAPARGPEPRSVSGTKHMASLVAFTMALLSKESALTTLPLLLLYRVARRDESLAAGMWRELRSLYWVPYALCLALFLCLRWSVVSIQAPAPVTPLDNILAFVPSSVRIRSALGVLWDYFALLNVPLMLSADYSYAQVPVVTSWLNPRALAGAALLATAGVVALGHRRAAIRFAAAFPFVALLVTSNLLFPIGTVKAERLLYFPSVGWVLLAAFGIDLLLQRDRYRPAAVLLLLVLVAGYAARTWSRNLDWRDDASLYRSMVKSAPQSAKSLYNFGLDLQLRHADEFAVPQFRRALAIYPGWADAAMSIGIAYERSGSIDDAAAWYAKALDVDPAFGKAHTNLCHVLYKRGRFAEAVEACRRGLRYAPTDANLLKGLGTSLLGVGEWDKGLAVLRRAVANNARDVVTQQYVAEMDRARAEDEQKDVRQ